MFGCKQQKNQTSNFSPILFGLWSCEGKTYKRANVWCNLTALTKAGLL